MTTRRHFLHHSLALLGGAAYANHAFAQSARVTKIVVPFAAGGVQDILARSMSNELGAALNASVIIENRPGAGGTVANAYVAKAAPDGYTLGVISTGHVVNPVLYSNIPYDTLKDFAGVAPLASLPSVLVVSPALGIKTVRELVAAAKAKPGSFNYATAGVGSAAHISAEKFRVAAGIDAVHVPLKATGEAINEVLSGRAHAVIAASIGALAFIKDSRIRLLGVTSPKRSKYLPEVPAIAESGLPGYAFDSWFGLLAPAGVTKAEADRVNAAVGTLLKSPVILERLDKQGIEPHAMGNDEFARLLKADYERMAQVVKASGAKVE